MVCVARAVPCAAAATAPIPALATPRAAPAPFDAPATAPLIPPPRLGELLVQLDGLAPEGDPPPEGAGGVVGPPPDGPADEPEEPPAECGPR